MLLVCLAAGGAVAAVGPRSSEIDGAASPPESCGQAKYDQVCQPNSDCVKTPGCAVLSSFYTTNLSACCAACGSNPRCSVFTLNKDTSTCWLRTGSSTPKGGHCITGKLRPPTPPVPPSPAPPPPVPPPGITFATKVVQFEGSDWGDAFYSLPCAVSPTSHRTPLRGVDSGTAGATGLWTSFAGPRCMFGTVNRMLYTSGAEGEGWTQRGIGPGFTEPSLDPTAVRTIGNLSQTTSPGASRFVADQTPQVLRFSPNGSLESHQATPAGVPPMSYVGLPCKAYKFRIGSGGAVNSEDGGLLQTVNYKCVNDSLLASRGGVAHPLSAGHSTLGLFHSRNGIQWSFTATVATWHATIGPDGKPDDEGPNENDIARLPSGKLLVVVRGDAGDGVPRKLLRPYFAVVSDDDGTTWSTPTPMVDTGGLPMGSARPRLLLLGPRGPLVLSGGRPGLYLWFNEAADGVSWVRVNLAAAHNAAAPTEQYCPEYVASNLNTTNVREGVCTLSTSYTSMVLAKPCSGMVFYDMVGGSHSSGCASSKSRVFGLGFQLSIGGCANNSQQHLSSAP
eukprot:m.469206 g.469206  ORF g.469206 m.469206 type:complete len:562 (+) comp28262_c0_seq1:65-1750(+)